MTICSLWWTQGAYVTGASNDQFTQSRIETWGPVLYDTAGTARLVGNEDITTARKITIPAEALAVGAIGMILPIDGGVYVISGMAADDNIAAGGGPYYAQGAASVIPIGRTPAGEQHDTLLVVGA